MSTVDPNGLLEYSVVYTDRALNHMSQKFQNVMRDISRMLKEVYQAHTVIIVPGSGTYGMEAVVRQLAKGKRCMTLRNGFFNFRWSQIFEMSKVIDEEIVIKARPVSHEKHAPFAPAPIEEVVEAIHQKKPELVFATHVETASGIILPDDYISSLSKAAHEVGALLVLDCIASGAIWIDMKKLGVDILTSAPQKGWTGSPCAGLVLVNERTLSMIEKSESDSFSLDLKKWLSIMRAYENGAHAYHATMPTDALATFHNVMQEAQKIGFETLYQKQNELGFKTRQLLAQKGFISLAAEGFEAPGVIVSYTDNPLIQNGKLFADNGIQIASGVPLKCDEPTDFSTFRLGLFGLDKLMNVDRTVSLLEDGLKRINS